MLLQNCQPPFGDAWIHHCLTNICLANEGLCHFKISKFNIIFNKFYINRLNAYRNQSIRIMNLWYRKPGLLETVLEVFLELKRLYM